MKVVIGSDHAGFEMKEFVKEHLAKKGITVSDVGAKSLESVDYPVFGKTVGNKVVKENYDFGIVICGTGIGISIAANKVKGVRAALVHDEETARLAKEHNNANVLAFGGRNTEKDMALKILDSYLSSTFEERHQKRIDLIEDESDDE